MYVFDLLCIFAYFHVVCDAYKLLVCNRFIHVKRRYFKEFEYAQINID